MGTKDVKHDANGLARITNNKLKVSSNVFFKYIREASVKYISSIYLITMED